MQRRRERASPEWIDWQAVEDEGRDWVGMREESVSPPVFCQRVNEYRGMNRRRGLSDGTMGNGSKDLSKK